MLKVVVKIILREFLRHAFLTRSITNFQNSTCENLSEIHFTEFRRSRRLAETLKSYSPTDASRRLSAQRIHRFNNQCNNRGLT